MKKYYFFVTVILLFFSASIAFKVGSLVDHSNTLNDDIGSQGGGPSFTTKNPCPLNSIYYDKYYDYKLFFGKWEIDGVLGYVDEEYLDYLKQEYFGKIIEYDYHTFASEGNLYDVTYHEAIIPIYKEYQKYHTDRLTLEDMGLEGEYFTAVMVTTYNDNGWQSIPEVGSWFYIKDNDTIIIFGSYTTFVALTAKRIDYEEGHTDSLYIWP